jgi:hypothetical protein
MATMNAFLLLGLALTLPDAGHAKAQQAVDIPSLPPGTLPPVLLPFDPSASRPVCLQKDEQGHGTSSARTFWLDPVRQNQYFVGVGSQEGKGPRSADRSRAVLVTTPASIAPVREVRVTPRVAGYVLEVLVEEGAQVKAGEVLARLDPREYQLKFGARSGLGAARPRSPGGGRVNGPDSRRGGQTSRG